ncbi:universal stress protein [Paraburkholderia azotifigens]|uniref:Universal stress protein n=2 Tax=Paraburkholderia azotifigens TaxID=2057004 RepID=A0ABU9RBN7_9BURK|nr:universal stress protein [Paraburkholderia azotifigens]
MSSFSRMLLVYDESAEAQAALNRCSQLSLALSAHVDVVSIVDSVTANATCAGMLSDLACSRMEEHARHALDAAVGHLANAGISAYGHLKYGRPADVISLHVAAFHADIVVIGHRVQKGLARWWGERPVHLDLAERLRGSTIVTVTPPLV